jgi:hypothetical protein
MMIIVNGYEFNVNTNLKGTLRLERTLLFLHWQL